MKLLTADKVLQALKDGKTVEYIEDPKEDWRIFVADRVVRLLLNENTKFRVMQEIVAIQSERFPKAEVDAPEIGTEYYFVDMSCEGFVRGYTWDNDCTDLDILKRGMLHLSEENAIAHAKAIIKLSGGSCE